MQTLLSRSHSRVDVPNFGAIQTFRSRSAGGRWSTRRRGLLDEGARGGDCGSGAVDDLEPLDAVPLLLGDVQDLLEPLRLPLQRVLFLAIAAGEPPAVALGGVVSDPAELLGLSFAVDGLLPHVEVGVVIGGGVGPVGRAPAPSGAPRGREPGAAHASVRGGAKLRLHFLVLGRSGVCEESWDPEVGIL